LGFVSFGVTFLKIRDFKLDYTSMHTGPLGAYSEERLIASAKLVKIPDGVDDVTAAAIFLKGMTTQVLLHKVFKVSS